MNATGNEILARILHGAGVTHFFHVPVIVPGAVKAMHRLGITSIVAHTEKAAAYMADGYARIALRSGVCAAQNIGGTNLAAGLRDARMAGVPVIALTGGASPATRYRHSYQDLDDMPVFAALTKFNAIVEDASRLSDLLHSAFRYATSGTPGPVHLELPGNTGQVLEAPCDAACESTPQYRDIPAVRQAAAEAEVRSAVDLLVGAARPVIVAGGGVRLSGAAEELCELARTLRIPVATSLSAKGCLPETDPLALGVVGEYSRDCANQAVYEADVVFYVGSRTGGLVTRNWTIPAPSARVVQLDINPENIGRNYRNTLAVCGDACTVLRQMRAMSLSGAQRETWLARIAELKTQWRNHAAAAILSAALPIRPERLAWELSQALPANAILTGDTGHTAAWFAQFVEATQPTQTFIRCHGSLGWSFPAALGAKCAAPERPVVCFTGDGAFYYHFAEIETAVRYGLNVVVVINNNDGFSQEQGLWPPGAGLDRNWKFGSVDFVALARAMGCRAQRVTDPTELRAALHSAFQASGPMVLDVVTDPTVLAETGWGPEGKPALFSGHH